jgi:hypothetical protein
MQIIRSASEGNVGAIFSFKCSKCSSIHEGSPSFEFVMPSQYERLPKEERQDNAKLGPDFCIIHTAGHFDFFIRVCLGIPIRGADGLFLWGVWILVSESDFRRYGDTWDDPVETDEYAGELCNDLSPYPDTLGLKAFAHPQRNGQRPMITLEATDHPLSVDFREGLTIEQAQQLAEACMRR